MPNSTPVERWNSGAPGYFWFTRRKAMVITHHGIGKRDAYGRFVILELKPSGMRFTDFGGFADSEQVFVQDWKPLSAGIEIEARATEVRSRRRPFSLLFWNCEHLASEIWNGEPESKQVKGWGWAAAGIIALIFFGR